MPGAVAPRRDWRLVLLDVTFIVGVNRPEAMSRCGDSVKRPADRSLGWPARLPISTALRYRAVTTSRRRRSGS